VLVERLPEQNGRGKKSLSQPTRLAAGKETPCCSPRQRRAYGGQLQNTPIDLAVIGVIDNADIPRETGKTKAK
jgi:hypothetical protein